MTITAFKIHPAAHLFPLMDENSGEFAELVEDIRKNGLREPIELFRSEILDGRNRLRACQRADVHPRFVSVDTDSPVGYVISKNLHRRHLTTAQRAEVAVRMLPMLEEETLERVSREVSDRARQQPRDEKGSFRRDPETDRDGWGNHQNPQTLDRVGSLVGIGRTTISYLRRLQAEAPELAERVSNGELTVDRAYKMAFHGSSEPAPPTKGRSNGKVREHLALFETLLMQMSGVVILSQIEKLDQSITSEEAARLDADLGRVTAALNRARRMLRERTTS